MIRALTVPQTFVFEFALALIFTVPLFAMVVWLAQAY